MPKTATQRLGENLRQIRKEKGMTQLELGKKLKLDVGYISYLENGKKNPTVMTIEKIAKALGVSVSELTK